MRNSESTGGGRVVEALLLAGILAGVLAERASAQLPARPADSVTLQGNAGRSSRGVKWGEPPGLSLEARQQVQTFITTAREIDGVSPESINWLQVLPELQAVLAAPSDSLVVRIDRPEADAGFGGAVNPALVSLKEAVTMLLVELPEAGKQKWQQLYADLAAARLNEVVHQGDQAGLARVASQFVETPAGWQAAERLGVRHLDAGQPAACIRYLERLRMSPNGRQSREPQLSLTIAAAWSLLDRDDQAGLVLAQLKTWLRQHPNASAGSSTDGESQAARFLKRVQSADVRELLDDLWSGLARDFEQEPLEHWTHPAGSVTNAASVAPVAATGEPLWRSYTDGFEQRPTLADRLPFATPWADYDREPYPQTPAQMAGLIELSLEYLDRLDIEESRVGLPAAQPLIVNDLAVFHTLDRLRAVDVVTGTVKWESFQQDPAFVEQFSLRNAKQALNFPRTDIRCPVNQAQQALLTARTRLDRTTGTLSTDGRHVYFVTGGGVASRATRFGMARLVEVIPRSSNTLRAVDLSTGRLVWEVGGPSDTPRLPGAGRFFLGPPACMEQGLFAVAEEDGHALLLQLDPETGETLWQQELGEVISPVINEALRRITGESPVLAGGLLVCTTSSGQVYAVSPEEQRIVWAMTYPTDIPPARRFPATMRMAAPPMNTDLQDDPNRWRQSVVMASGGRLILSAVDSPVLTCLDVVTGDVLWKQPRKDSLFVATVYRKRAVLVGEYGVRSLDLESGQPEWTAAFENRIPAGRGVRSGDIYHLPIATVVRPESPSSPGSTGFPEPPDTGDRRAAAGSGNASSEADGLASVPRFQGALVSIDLQTGRILAESPLPAGVRAGNLAAARGRLIAQGFDSVIGFESLTEQRARLEPLVRAEEPDPGALLTRARQRLHNGDRQGIEDLLRALNRLADIAASDSPPSGAAREPSVVQLRRDAESLLISQILEMTKHGEGLDDRLFQLLDRIDLDASSQLTMLRVKTDSLIQRGQFAEAFRQLMTLASRAEAAGELDAGRMTLTDRGVTLSLRQWVAGRLAEVYRTAAIADSGADQLAEIESALRESLQAGFQAPETRRAQELMRWLDLFSWHTAAREVRLTLAREQPADRLPIVERLVGPLLTADHSTTVMKAHVALGNAYATAGLGAATLEVQRDLERSMRADAENPQSRLLNDQAWAAVRKQWRQTAAVAEALSRTQWPNTSPVESLEEAEPETWQNRHLVERLGAASAPFRGWVLELTEDGLAAIDAAGRTAWTVSAADVPGFPNPARERFRAIWMTGGSLFAIVINSEMAVFDAGSSPPQRLWSQSLTANDPALLPFGQKSFEFGMLVSTYRLRSGSRSLASVDLLTPNRFVWRSGNRLHVVDSRTGELLWERPAPSGEGFVFGDDRLIVLAETAPASSRVFDASTGRLLSTFDLPDRTYLVSASSVSPVFVTPDQRQLIFFCLDVLSGERKWEVVTDASAISLPSGARLITLLPEGRLQVRELSDGSLTADLEIQKPQQRSGELQLHETPEGFVLFSWAPTSQFRFGLNRLSTAAREYAPVNGYACGVDLNRKKVLWERQLPASFLPRPQPRDLPVVLMASSQTRTDDGVNLKTPRFHVTVLDTRNGLTVATLTTDEPFRNVDARVRADGGGESPQVEVRVTGSREPVTMLLDYPAEKVPAENPQTR